jgi:hypothetical protein
MIEITRIGMNVSEVLRVGIASALSEANTTSVTIVATNQPRVLMFSRIETRFQSSQILIASVSWTTRPYAVHSPSRCWPPRRPRSRWGKSRRSLARNADSWGFLFGLVNERIGDRRWSSLLRPERASGIYKPPICIVKCVQDSAAFERSCQWIVGT